MPDPIVGGKVQRCSNDPLAVLTDHFTAAEWARYAQGPNPDPSSSPSPNPNPNPCPYPNPYPNPTLTLTLTLLPYP